LSVRSPLRECYPARVDSPLFRLSLDDARIPWRSTRHPGVAWHPVDAVEKQLPPDSAPVVLIRMAPGCSYPAHRHVGSEDVLVLQGAYEDELGEHGPGTFLRYAAGSTHAPVARGDRRLPESAENHACILFTIARGGVLNL